MATRVETGGEPTLNRLVDIFARKRRAQACTWKNYDAPEYNTDLIADRVARKIARHAKPFRALDS